MIGKFVTSKAGHDKDALYVVVGHDRDSVLLADGRLKTINKPKRKNIKHIQPIQKKVDEELVVAIKNGVATDVQIKFAIKHYNS